MLPSKKILHIHSWYYLLLVGASLFFLFYLTVSWAAGMWRILRFLLMIVWWVLIAWWAQTTVKSTIPLLEISGAPSWLIWISLFAVGSALPDILLAFWLQRFGWGELATYVIIGSNVATVLLVWWVAARMAFITQNTRMLSKEICITMVSSLAIWAVFLLGFRTTETITLGVLHWLFLIACWIVSSVLVLKPWLHSLQQPISSMMHQKKQLISMLFWLCVLVIWTTCVLIVALESVKHSLIPIQLLWSWFLALCLSLPELALVYYAWKKNQESLALWTVLWSNSINAFWILWLLFLLQPLTVNSSLLRDIGFLFVCQILLLFTVKFNKLHALYHFTWMLLMGLYLSYLFFLIHK